MITTEQRIKAVREAVAKKKITGTEASLYLKETCGVDYADVLRNEQRKRVYISSALALTLILFFGGFLVLNPAIVGFVSLDFAEGNSSDINVTVPGPFTGVSISGVLRGEGNATIYLDTENESYVVARVLSDNGEIRTNAAGYSVGDQVSLVHGPELASYYFDDGLQSIPIDVPFTLWQNGTLIVVDTLNAKTYRLPIIVGLAQRVRTITDKCEDTCMLHAQNGTLRVEVEGEDTTFALTKVNTSTVSNQAPNLVFALPTINATTITSIDLDSYFHDADNDELVYSIGSSIHNSVTLNGSVLTIVPISNGNETISVYASDMHELVPASIMVVSVIGADSNVSQNSSQNETLNDSSSGTAVVITEPSQANSSSSLQSNNTTTIEPQSVDCSNPDPNLRPVECLIANSEKYFPDQDIYWENLDRVNVAKFTEIGNLLIRGDVIEHATGSPGPRDFRVATIDIDGNSIPTVWIDSEGNLHLKGVLIEENTNLKPPAGSYSVMSKRSIYLMYADTESGNVYLRGNIIPLRRVI